jgi:hypothetical protein
MKQYHAQALFANNDNKGERSFASTQNPQGVTLSNLPGAKSKV